MSQDDPYLAPLRPEACPCCGAGLSSDGNGRGRYREFAYDCGAAGFQRERIEEDNWSLAPELLYRGPIRWTVACPAAMDTMMNATRSTLPPP
jgi:hypothetical protein